MTPNEIAKQLLKEQNLIIPIDVYKLANDLNYEVYETDFTNNPDEVIRPAETVTICLRNTGFTPTIVINSILNPLKKRFVLAREIGRIKIYIDKQNIKSLSLDGYSFQYVTRPDSVDIDTKNAEDFAFELLMPESEVFSFYNTLSTPYLQPFIGKFKLSIMTIEDRLNQLKLRYIV
jgi:Zn-dependent peptidase ImmA (M78 family)